MKPATIILGVLLFSSGGAAGFFVSKSMYKKKYQRYADEEIEAVKKVYAKHFGGESKTVESNKEKQPESQEKHFVSKSSLDAPIQKKYVDYAGIYKSEEDPVVKEKRSTRILEPKNIYILTPEEFRESNNPTSTLFYYKDGILADDDYNIIKKPEEIIGPDALKSFGRYEDDAVYVRNDSLNKDFEILLDNRNYIDVSPHGSGVPSDD